VRSKFLRLLTVCAAALTVHAQNKPAALGRPASDDQIKQQDITVLPNGKGLPEGQGTAAEGEAVYKSQCASCHGANGEGLPQGPALVGGIGSLASENPVRTVGSYWPYATSVWDYIHRAMPLQQPGSLSANDTYAVIAFLLERNKIIQAGEVMNQDTLPKVRMPNRDGFVPDARPDIATSPHPSASKGTSNSAAKNSKTDSK
jgi:S-disulfanyl-L-cysteine oxidoreductase SoxD